MMRAEKGEECLGNDYILKHGKLQVAGYDVIAEGQRRRSQGAFVDISSCFVLNQSSYNSKLSRLLKPAATPPSSLSFPFVRSK
jgi:hypothetical protein